MKYMIYAISIIGFIALALFGKLIYDHCSELREKQARQEAVLLKQSEILAVNTAMLRALMSPHSPNEKQATRKEGLQMEVMP